MFPRNDTRMAFSRHITFTSKIIGLRKFYGIKSFQSCLKLFMTMAGCSPLFSVFHIAKLLVSRVPCLSCLQTIKSKFEGNFHIGESRPSMLIHFFDEINSISFDFALENFSIKMPAA